MKRLFFTLILSVLVLAPATGYAYESNICKGTTTCTEGEVGPFMQGITVGCGNRGDCSLDDIMQVFVNVGNWVVGIIGAIVLLMYIVGGFYWLASGGRKEWVDKGKKYMTISTAGLLIVMFSYLGIITLRSALEGGSVLGENLEGYVSCSGAESEGKSCALNSTCSEGGFVCESLCQQQFGDQINTDASEGLFKSVTWYDCVDINAYPDNSSEGAIWKNGCSQNLCPGAAEIQCCQLEAYQF